MSVLKKTYTSYVRPSLEYGATALGSAAKTSLKKVDKVQNIGLRIMTGGMRSTPISTMESITSLQTTEERRENKILSQYTKIEMLENQPLNKRVQKTNSTQRLQRSNFIAEARKLKQKYNLDTVSLKKNETLQ